MKYFISYYNTYGIKEETAQTFEADDYDTYAEVMEKTMTAIKDYERAIIHESFYASIDDIMESFNGQYTLIVVEDDYGNEIIKWRVYLPFTIDYEKNKLSFRGTALYYDIPDTSMTVLEVINNHK